MSTEKGRTERNKRKEKAMALLITKPDCTHGSILGALFCSIFLGGEASQGGYAE